MLTRPMKHNNSPSEHTTTHYQTDIFPTTIHQKHVLARTRKIMPLALARFKTPRPKTDHDVPESCEHECIYRAVRGVPPTQKTKDVEQLDQAATSRNCTKPFLAYHTRKRR